MPKLRSTYDRRLIHKTSYEGRKQWRRQKEEVGWVLASVRQPNAEGVRSEAPRGRGAAGAETSAEGARGGGRVWYVPLSPSGANHITVYQKRTRLAQSAIRRGGFSNSELRMPNTAESHEYRPSDQCCHMTFWIQPRFRKYKNPGIENYIQSSKIKGFKPTTVTCCINYKLTKAYILI